MTGISNLPPGTGGTPGTLDCPPQVHEQAGAKVCASVPCVPSVPPSISYKTIKEIDRNGLRNVPERQSWFVAQVVTKAETQAVELLGVHKIEAYCPVETHIRRHSNVRRRKHYAVPLLPGYVFIRLPLADEEPGDLPDTDALDLVRKVPVVGGLVAVAGKPRAVADRWIEALLAAEKAGAFDYRPRGRPNYAAGDQLRIMTGAMAGRIAEFQCRKGARLKLLLEPLDARGEVIENADRLRLKVEPEAVEPLVQAEPANPAEGHWPPPPDITP